MASSLRALDGDFFPFADALVREAGMAGLAPRVTSTRRSRAEQQRLYDRFLRGESQYPVALPGTSAHEFGLAIDLIVTPYEALSDLGEMWESWGGSWGGHKRDPIHFQAPMAHGALATRETATERPWEATVLDIAAGFVPYYGGIELTADILRQLFPSLKDSEILQILAEPSRLLF